MKRKIGLVLVFLLSLSATGCHDLYYQKIDELQERIYDIEDICDQINTNLAAIQALVRVIQNQDMITGITEIKSGNTVTGYKINFVRHESVTIVNGEDGKKPLVSSRQNPEDGNYYWCVQYGDGAYEWLLAPDGSKMLSIGLLPYVTIRNNSFYYTVDGVNWTELGTANGQDADQMFKYIDIRTNFVLFYLSSGEVLKIPTYSTFLLLQQEIFKVNENVLAQISLVTAAIDKLVYISRLAPILSGKDTVGLSIALSNGKSFQIHDWTETITPSIFIKKAADGKMYWAYTMGDSPDQWVLTATGEKIPATSEAVEVPLVSVTRDTDGQYYWTVTLGEKSEFLRYPVDDSWEPHAIDSVKRAFLAVDNYNDSLVVMLKDSTRFVLPKQYSVSLTDSDGQPVNGSITMEEVAGGDEAVLNYTVYGSGADLSLMAQAGFSAKQEIIDERTGRIRIKAPATFNSGEGRIIALFTFPGDTPVSTFKSITIDKN